VKKCISCAKDIPDTAFHCVFCGSKQGQPQAAGPAQKTIMGYSAADLAKLLPQQQGGAQPPQGGYVPGGSDQRTMMVGAGGAPSPAGPSDQRTMMAGVGGGPVPPAGPADQRTMMAGVGGAPVGGPGGGQQDQRTMMAGSMGAPPMGHGGMPQQPMQPMHQQPMQPMHQQPMHQQPMHQQPMMQGPSGQRPQYLASQSARREMSPTEPWAGSLRAMLIIFGIAMLVMFAAPLSFEPMRFMWQDLTSSLPLKAKLWPLLFGGLGVLSLLFGLLPVPTSIRGVIAAIVGITPVVVAATMGGMPGAGGELGMNMGGWQAYAVLAGLVLAPTGLLLRSAYRQAILGRLLATIGGLALLAPFLIPERGALPIVQMFQSLGGGGGLKMQLAIIWMLVLPVSALLGIIMSWLPSGTSGGTGFFAWMLILWTAGLILVGLVVAITSGADIGGIVKQPGVLYALVCTLGFSALAAYGLATIFGKSLEA
jgi:hypothetical protein